jgi:tetratricopeptide (TPR) repeat protein
MQASERRRKILKIFQEKGKLTYNEILNESSELGDPIDILSDLDTLVFFKFLQHRKTQRHMEIGLEELELRPKTKELPLDDHKILSRLTPLEQEYPPWYRKLAILTVLTRMMNMEEVLESVNIRYPHVMWSRFLVEASLKILEDGKFISAEKKKDSITYTRGSKGETLLKKSPIQQFSILKKLTDEFTGEFRTHEILKIVGENNESGISSGRIVRHFQRKYGIRGNKRRAIRNTLKNMVFSGLLRVAGGTEKRGGHVYFLGKTTEHLLLKNEVEIMHDIKDFKGTVKQFFETYKSDIKKDIQSTIERVLEDLEQCKGDLWSISSGIWTNHIMLLSGYLQEKTDAWEKQILQCIVACILSRLLPPQISLDLLKDYSLPSPVSEKEYLYYSGIVREYYFSLTETYMSLSRYEEAFSSFERLKLLSWESFDFLLLKGRIKMSQCDVRNQNEFIGVLTTFENARNRACEKSKRREEALALFYIGLLHFRRGDFEEAKKAWHKCRNLESSNNLRINLHHNLANAYRLSGEFDKAEECYQDSIYCARPPLGIGELDVISQGLHGLRAKSFLGLANTLIDSCSWGRAEKILRELIQECTEKGILPVVAIAKTNLGDLLTRKKNFRKALLYHEEALKLVDKHENPHEYGIILINLGNALRLLQRFDEALDAFEKAFEVIGKEESLLLQELELCLADLYIDMGAPEKSLELSHSVLQERWLDNSRSEAKAQQIQGKVYLLKKDYREALGHLEKSKRIFHELALDYELFEIYKLLETCCRALNSEKEAHYRIERETLQQKLGLPD